MHQLAVSNLSNLWFAPNYRSNVKQWLHRLDAFVTYVDTHFTNINIVTKINKLFLTKIL